MKLTSLAFSHGAPIPAKYTCKGEDVSPPLTIENVPGEAKSLALIIDDPDAPAGDWVHWLVWNIPSRTKDIIEGILPPGAALGTNDFGKQAYGGPCPPSGTHRYFFKLYALDTLLNLPMTTTKKDLLSALEGHVIEQAELMGTFAKI